MWRARKALPQPPSSLHPKTPSSPPLPGQLPTCFHGRQPNQPRPCPRPLPQPHDPSAPGTGLGLCDVIAWGHSEPELCGEGREKALGAGTLPPSPRIRRHFRTPFAQGLHRWGDASDKTVTGQSQHLELGGTRDKLAGSWD